MFRAKLFVPALVLGMGLIASEQSAKADVGVNIRIGAPAPYRPVPAPIYRPAPIVVARPVVVPVYQPAPVVVPHHGCYKVFYRGCASEPWRFYSEFHHHGRAHDVAEGLRYQGYEAYVAH